MNKTSLIIQMLHILRAHNDYVPLTTLAKELETTVRNVRAYKVDLEVAGYQIDSRRGTGGGYYLNQSALLPTALLSSDETKAIDLAVKFLAQRPEFLYFNDFVRACGKFRTGNSVTEPQRTIFQQSVSVKINGTIRKMVDVLQAATQDCKAVQLDYASLTRKRHSFRKVEIYPYDVVNVNGAYYVVGYALEHHAYRSYKITLERMRSVKVLNHSFIRNSDYQLSHHIGTKSIAKTGNQTVSLEIFGDLAVFVSENNIGLESTSFFVGDVLHLTTTFENEKACDSFILSLGSDAKVVGPPEVKVRLRDKVNQMLHLLDSE